MQGFQSQLKKRETSVHKWLFFVLPPYRFMLKNFENKPCFDFEILSAHVEECG
jgi:hypothetical protein